MPDHQWPADDCTGTVRVAAADVPTLVEALQLGLRPGPASPATDEIPRPVAPAPAVDAVRLDTVTEAREDGVG